VHHITEVSCQCRPPGRFVSNVEVLNQILSSLSLSSFKGVNPHRYTPLLLAIGNGHDKCIPLLLEAGADVHTVQASCQCRRLIFLLLAFTTRVAANEEG